MHDGGTQQVKIHFATMRGGLFQINKHFIAQDGRNWIFFSIFAVWFEDWS